jgi:hypothetical protein
MAAFETRWVADGKSFIKLFLISTEILLYAGLCIMLGCLVLTLSHIGICL